MRGQILFAITDFKTANFALQIQKTSNSSPDQVPRVILTETIGRQENVDFEDNLWIKEGLKLDKIRVPDFGQLAIVGKKVQYVHKGQGQKSSSSRPRSYRVRYGEHGLELLRIRPSMETTWNPVTL